MKYFWLIIITFILLTLHAAGLEEAPQQIDQINWLLNMEEAQQIAAEKNLPIFVHFTGSDWCGWCFKLEEEVYSKQVFQDYADENLVMVKIDFPKHLQQPDEIKIYNNSLARKYQITGFPTVLLLDKEGKILGRTGYQDGGASKYVDHLQDLLKRE